ncbi:MAG: hypothetical protein AB1649_05695 [Chloroflexota bacterium]
MESNDAVVGAIIFIALIIGANFIMYAIARGAARPGQKGFWETISKSLNSSTRSKDDSMDELRRRMEELQKGKKDGTGDSE